MKNEKLERVERKWILFPQSENQLVFITGDAKMRRRITFPRIEELQQGKHWWLVERVWFRTEQEVASKEKVSLPEEKKRIESRLVCSLFSLPLQIEGKRKLLFGCLIKLLVK